VNRLAQIIQSGDVFLLVCYECRDVIGEPLLSLEHVEARLFKHMSVAHNKKLKLKTDPDGKVQTYGVDP
jgi:hypothetical protein